MENLEKAKAGSAAAPTATGGGTAANASANASKKQKTSAFDAEYWGFEDQSVPTLVCLARYKRNHQLINELLSPAPLPPREKFEPTATAEDIVKLEAEIKVLEEQNKKLLSGSVGSILDL